MHRLALAALVIAPAILAGCSSPDTPPLPGTLTLPPPTDAELDAALLGSLLFNGTDAFALAETQVLYPNGTTRYRIPGTTGNAEVRAWLLDTVAKLGFQAREDPFTARWACEQRTFVNVLGERDTGKPTVFLAAHFDTRPMADKDKNASRRGEPVAGANDGAAGVAVVLELARALDARLANISISLAFFDAEDGGRYGGFDDNGPCTDWILGSTHYAGTLDAAALERTRALIVVDMPGDKDLKLLREGFSAMEPHRRLQDWVWRSARDLGYAGYFADEVGAPITDDHLPFSGCMLALDVIHLQSRAGDPFPATHHTTHDDLAHLSAKSLEVVGRSLELALLRLDRSAPFQAGEWERPTGACNT